MVSKQGKNRKLGENSFKLKIQSETEKTMGCYNPIVATNHN